MFTTQVESNEHFSAHEIYFYDPEGEAVPHELAMGACVEITTCSDTGEEGKEFIERKIEIRLRKLKI